MTVKSSMSDMGQSEHANVIKTMGDHLDSLIAVVVTETSTNIKASIAAAVNSLCRTGGHMEKRMLGEPYVAADLSVFLEELGKAKAACRQAKELGLCSVLAKDGTEKFDNSRMELIAFIEVFKAGAYFLLSL